MLTHIRRILSSSLVKIVMGLIVVCLIGTFYYAQVTRTLSKDVHAFALAERELSTAAFLPGASNNPLRDSTNRALVDVLMGTLATRERAARAEEGIALLKQLELEIDRIGDVRDAIAPVRDRLDTESILMRLRWGGDLQQLSHLAQKQSSIAADIRGLSYGANYHTSQIFKRVIADGGELSRAHVASLNSEIPQVEAQFNQRSNLYTDLEAINHEIASVLSRLPGGSDE